MFENAFWIASPEKDCDGVLRFSKRFSLKKELKSAVLSLTANGVYEARINDRRVGKFIFAPGCTDYGYRQQYQTYDVTELAKNDNLLTVEVGKGWFHSRMSAGRGDYFHKPCAMIAELSLEYTDGTRETVYSDASWGVCATATVFNDLYDGETFDATAAAAAGVPVRIADLDKRILLPQIGEEIHEHEILSVKEVILTPKGERVLDFGQNIVGYPQFTVCAKAGDRVEISCAEVLDYEGNFYNDNYRTAKSKVTYLCRDGEQTYKPHFTFYGFRYLRLDSFPGEINPDDFKAIAVYSDLRRTGWLTTANAKLNRLISNAFWSQRDNFLDIPTDCPQRDERQGWTGDAQVFARTACLNFDVKKFFEKWLGDVRADQLENGAIPDMIPKIYNDNHTSTAWGDAATMVPWQVYNAYGDKKVLEDNFDTMCRWVDYMTSDTSVLFLWKASQKHFGDWLGLDAPEGSYTGSTDTDFIASAFYAYSASLVIRAGHILGRDVKKYEELHANIVAAFKAALPAPKTQTEHVLVLNFGLTDRPEEIAAELDDMIRKNGMHLQTGFVGTPYLLHVLSEHGYCDTAYSLLLQESYPSWLYPVNHGATSIWEHWDGVREDGTFWSRDMNSYNHYAYGSVLDWIYTVAAGIQTDPEYPGYEKAIIAPHPDRRLPWIEASLDTPHGKISSRFTCEGDDVRYEIETPVEATVILGNCTKHVAPGSYLFYGKLD